ncbi:MAG: hypothetical protein MR761_04505 [Butyricicoccus porcorum]|nr:hypothetical protein [Butyricicoccus porcorum]
MRILQTRRTNASGGFLYALSLSDGKLNPKKAITRAEAAQIIVTYDNNASPF